MLGLTFTRLEAEIVGLILLIAMGCLWLGFHDAGVKREAIAPVIAAAQAASAAAAVKAAQVDATQQGNLNAAHDQIQAQQVKIAGLAGAVADARRLRDDAVRRAAAAQGARTSAGSPAGGDAAADVVPWRLYTSALGARAEAESDAADLATALAGRSVSGQLCARDYDALR